MGCGRREAQKCISEVPCCGPDSPVLFTRTQNATRKSEWAQCLLQTDLCVRDLPTLSPGGLGQSRPVWGHRGEDSGVHWGQEHPPVQTQTAHVEA